MHIRRYVPILVALATLVVVVSCNSISQRKVAQIGPQDPLGSAHWTGTLTMPSGPHGAYDVSGTASATATLASELLVGDYHVNVNASPTDKATIIACGDVAAPTGA